MYVNHLQTSYLNKVLDKNATDKSNMEVFLTVKKLKNSEELSTDIRKIIYSFLSNKSTFIMINISN